MLFGVCAADKCQCVYTVNYFVSHIDGLYIK